ncbi:hypothetical protein BJ684DRAFT_20966 [Piptocephalis cylindrospora]|uniref:Uncharacterized protein n=1 Tax=Piptocephalis cylindrospora TaxID=1907219 RepID=A0A4P9Y1T3_9FUNG|nr:hypothetical protein BJ684DRAFT_20966 [Piptocephalis cylindrospora]|eukprot:RKP12502.1 hypothetical protein BJ684DRAFT_20966 [Piptocephalis cylindrospora]
MTAPPHVQMDIFHVLTAVIIWHYCQYPYSSEVVSDFLPDFLPQCLQLTGRDPYESWTAFVELFEKTQSGKGFTLRRDIVKILDQMEIRMKMELFLQQLAHLIRDGIHFSTSKAILLTEESVMGFSIREIHGMYTRLGRVRIRELHERLMEVHKLLGDKSLKGSDLVKALVAGEIMEDGSIPHDPSMEVQPFSSEDPMETETSYWKTRSQLAALPLGSLSGRLPVPYHALNVGVHAIRHGLPDAEMWLTDAQRAAHELQDTAAANQAGRQLGMYRRQAYGEGTLDEIRAQILAQGSKKPKMLQPLLLDTFRGVIHNVPPCHDVPHEEKGDLEEGLLTLVIQGDISQLWVALSHRLESSLSDDFSADSLSFYNQLMTNPACPSQVRELIRLTLAVHLRREGHTVKALPLLLSTEVERIDSPSLALLHSLVLAEVYLEMGEIEGSKGSRVRRILDCIQYHVRSTDDVDMYAALDLLEAKWCILRGVDVKNRSEAERHDYLTRAQQHLSRIVQGYGTRRVKQRAHVEEAQAYADLLLDVSKGMEG